MNALADMSAEQVIAQFETDVVFEGLSFAPRHGRSQARDELSRRGANALVPIIRHLQANTPQDDRNLRAAWKSLISDINRDLVRSSPSMPKDLSEWLAWAEKMVLPGADAIPVFGA